jgi:hypothetical protein
MKVFREKLKKHRGEYFVVYQPADSEIKFATLSLVFPNNSFDCAGIATAMESELENWLYRFPVPTMVSSFDAKDDLISLKSCRDDHHLMGFKSKTGEIIGRWGTFRNDEMPSEFSSDEYLEHVYAGVPCRPVEEIRRKARAEANSIRRAAALIVLLVILVPVAIQVASLGIAWFGYLVSVVSILFGIYKAAKALGWIKPSEGEKRKTEKRSKMEHYYYHCERNPEGFNRLKMENFEREAVEQTRAEADAISDDDVENLK